MKDSAKSPILETVKMVIRLLIFWLPVIATFIADYESKGLVIALSTAATVVDKYIHEDKEIKFKGLLPF